MRTALLLRTVFLPFLDVPVDEGTHANAGGRCRAPPRRCSKCDGTLLLLLVVFCSGRHRTLCARRARTQVAWPVPLDRPCGVSLVGIEQVVIGCHGHRPACARCAALCRVSAVAKPAAALVAKLILLSNGRAE